MNNCVWYFCIYLYGLSLNGWHALLCITNKRHDLTITTHAIKRHFLIWMTMVRQTTKRQCSCVLTLKYTFICVYWWTRQRIHNTLIAVDRYLRLMGDKTIPDSAEPRLESFYPPFVAGIDLPHQCVVDSYNLHNGKISYTSKMAFFAEWCSGYNKCTNITHCGLVTPCGDRFWINSGPGNYLLPDSNKPLPNCALSGESLKIPSHKTILKNCIFKIMPRFSSGQ